MTDDFTTANVERAREFLRSSGALQINELMKLMHAEVTLELPFALPRMPRRLQGRAAVEQFLRTTADSFSAFQMIVDAIYSTGNIVIVEHHSRGVVAANKRTYENRYVTIFEFTTSGEIVAWKEYFDPGVVLRAFA